MTHAPPPSLGDAAAEGPSPTCPHGSCRTGIRQRPPRVQRISFLSDTSPPLALLALQSFLSKGWCRAAGLGRFGLESLSPECRLGKPHIWVAGQHGVWWLRDCPSTAPKDVPGGGAGQGSPHSPVSPFLPSCPCQSLSLLPSHCFATCSQSPKHRHSLFVTPCSPSMLCSSRPYL